MAIIGVFATSFTRAAVTALFDQRLDPMGALGLSGMASKFAGTGSPGTGSTPGSVAHFGQISNPDIPQITRLVRSRHT
eukprot:2723296-Pleurochrysis_carterae.AAC.1